MGDSFLGKLLISGVAIGGFIFPEPASSLTGVTILGAVWGYDLIDNGDGKQ